MQKKAFLSTGSPRDKEVARLKCELARVTKEHDFFQRAFTFNAIPNLPRAYKEALFDGRSSS